MRQFRPAHATLTWLLRFLTDLPCLEPRRRRSRWPDLPNPLQTKRMWPNDRHSDPWLCVLGRGQPWLDNAAGRCAMKGVRRARAQGMEVRRRKRRGEKAGGDGESWKREDGEEEEGRAADEQRGKQLRATSPTKEPSTRTAAPALAEPPCEEAFTGPPPVACSSAPVAFSRSPHSMPHHPSLPLLHKHTGPPAP